MAVIRLRGSHYTRDVRLDRVPELDPRSRRYGIRELLPLEGLRGRSWPLRARLNQGTEGACVGFSWTHELAAIPIQAAVDDSYARMVYREAQRIDEWAGEAYEGTSVLAGAKICQREGHFDEYRWAFGLEDALRTLAHYGPVVFGLNWYEGMFYPRPSGLLEPNSEWGTLAGGHAILGRGIITKPRLVGEKRGAVGPVVRLSNSWGASWGAAGECFLRVEDLERLLREWGECCVPVGRHVPEPEELGA